MITGTASLAALVACGAALPTTPLKMQVFVLWNNEPYDLSEIKGVYTSRHAAEAALALLKHPGLYDIGVFPLL